MRRLLLLCAAGVVGVLAFLTATPSYAKCELHPGDERPYWFDPTHINDDAAGHKKVWLSQAACEARTEDFVCATWMKENYPGCLMPDYAARRAADGAVPSPIAPPARAPTPAAKAVPTTSGPPKSSNTPPKPSSGVAACTSEPCPSKEWGDPSKYPEGSDEWATAWCAQTNKQGERFYSGTPEECSVTVKATYSAQTGGKFSKFEGGSGSAAAVAATPNTKLSSNGASAGFRVDPATGRRCLSGRAGEPWRPQSDSLYTVYNYKVTNACNVAIGFKGIAVRGEMYSQTIGGNSTLEISCHDSSSGDGCHGITGFQELP